MKKNLIYLFLIFFVGFSYCKADWLKVKVPPQYQNTLILDIKFLPNDLNYGWACGNEGLIIRTTDGGKTWSSYVSPGYEQFESINFVDRLHGFVSGPIPGSVNEGNLYKTSDGGKSWTKITPPLASKEVTLWGNYFIDSMTGMVIGGDCQSGNQSFYKTSDGGKTWSVNMGYANYSKLSDVILYNPTGLGYAVGSGVIWKTLDGGNKWEIYCFTGGNDWHEDLAIKDSTILLPYAVSCDGNLGVGSNIGGIRISRDMGATWTNHSLDASMFGATLIDSKRGWVCGLGGKVYYTSNAGETWELKNGGIPANADLDNLWSDGKNELWMTGRGMLYKWTDSTITEKDTSTTDTTKIEYSSTKIYSDANNIIIENPNNLKIKKILIYDLIGRLYEESPDYSGDAELKTIYLPKPLMLGSYFCIIETPEQIYRFKIMINEE